MSIRVAFVLLLACGQSSTPVKDLSPAEQVTLCEQFRKDICGKADYATFCAKSCLATCKDAQQSGAITQECMDTTDGSLPTDDAVAECGATGDLSVCARGGGCMFDALEAACE